MFKVQGFRVLGSGLQSGSEPWCLRPGGFWCRCVKSYGVWDVGGLDNSGLEGPSVCEGVSRIHWFRTSGFIFHV